MKITGQQIADGVNAWVADELKNGPGREYDLGKFLFTVGSGTIGFLLVAIKVVKSPTAWTFWLTLCFLSLVVAIVISAIMVQPKKWSIEGDTDLFDKRAEIVKRTVYLARLWFAAWIVGLGAGVWSVFH